MGDLDLCYKQGTMKERQQNLPPISAPGWESNGAQELTGDKLKVNLATLTELQTAAESLADGMTLSEALSKTSPNTADLVSYYWSFEEMCRMAWGYYYLHDGERTPEGVRAGYWHCRSRWSQALEQNYGWTRSMTRQATNAVDKVLSDDWHQILAAVTDQATADQIWTDNGNPQPIICVATSETN